MPVYERTMIKIIIFFFVILLNYVNAGTLTISSSTFSKIKTGEIGNLDLAFSTASTIPQDGKIVITLPGGFDTTGITVTISSGIDGTIATTKTGQVVTITRQNDGNEIAVSASVTIIINNLLAMLPPSPPVRAASSVRLPHRRSSGSARSREASKNEHPESRAVVKH